MNLEQHTESEYIGSFQPILLEEMEGVELMNRVDTKFVFSRTLLPGILAKLGSEYRILEVNGVRLNSYITQYFDTSGYQLYLDHHNERSLRYKVRIRQYVGSGIYFLEVKKKYKGRTDKKRISVSNFEDTISQGSRAYITAVIGNDLVLEPKLKNMFDRITLVNKNSKERLTIDINLAYKDQIGEKLYQNVVVAELKQDGMDQESLFYQLMKKHLIHPVGFSKYCVGAVVMNRALKYNNFKSKLLLMDKLKE